MDINTVFGHSRTMDPNMTLSSNTDHAFNMALGDEQDTHINMVPSSSSSSSMVECRQMQLVHFPDAQTRNNHT